MTKKEIKNILSNPQGKLIAVDLDLTLTKGKDYWGDKTQYIEPNQKMIDYVNNLYIKGGHIIIYTARMPLMYPETLGWLLSHNVLFHGIAMRIKPGSDCYIDDKAINLEDIVV